MGQHVFKNVTFSLNTVFGLVIMLYSASRWKILVVAIIQSHIQIYYLTCQTSPDNIYNFIYNYAKK